MAPPLRADWSCRSRYDGSEAQRQRGPAVARLSEARASEFAPVRMSAAKPRATVGLSQPRNNILPQTSAGLPRIVLCLCQQVVSDVGAVAFPSLECDKGLPQSVTQLHPVTRRRHCHLAKRKGCKAKLPAKGLHFIIVGVLAKFEVYCTCHNAVARWTAG